MINSLEKLEIVKDRGESAQILGACRRRLRRRNAFGLIQEYCTKLDFVIFCGGKQRFARRAERRGSQGIGR